MPFNASNRGKSTNPSTLNGSQTFSQLHVRANFIGSAKRPFTTPAKIASSMPRIRCQAILVVKLEERLVHRSEAVWGGWTQSLRRMFSRKET